LNEQAAEAAVGFESVNGIFLENNPAVSIDARICLFAPRQTNKSIQQGLTTLL